MRTKSARACCKVGVKSACFLHLLYEKLRFRVHIENVYILDVSIDMQ